MNYDSVAPERYKTGVIKTMLHRAYTVCSTWELFHQEIERLKQLFVNNNFPLLLIETQINKFLNFKLHNDSTVKSDNNINVYFKNQMSSQYKQQEES